MQGLKGKETMTKRPKCAFKDCNNPVMRSTLRPGNKPGPLLSVCEECFKADRMFPGEPPTSGTGVTPPIGPGPGKPCPRCSEPLVEPAVCVSCGYPLSVPQEPTLAEVASDEDIMNDAPICFIQRTREDHCPVCKSFPYDGSGLTIDWLIGRLCSLAEERGEKFLLLGMDQPEIDLETGEPSEVRLSEQSLERLAEFLPGYQIIGPGCEHLNIYDPYPYPDPERRVYWCRDCGALLMNGGRGRVIKVGEEA